MKLKITLNFRPFNDPEERQDAGYFNGFSRKNHATIDINSNDCLLEQILTVYHEITHALIEFLTKYGRKNKHFYRKNKKLREDWKRTEGENELEEQMCLQVENSAKIVLLKHLPNRFLKAFFGD